MNTIRQSTYYIPFSTCAFPKVQFSLIICPPGARYFHTAFSDVCTYGIFAFLRYTQLTALNRLRNEFCFQPFLIKISMAPSTQLLIGLCKFNVPRRSFGNYGSYCGSCLTPGGRLFILLRYLTEYISMTYVET